MEPGQRRLSVTQSSRDTKPGPRKGEISYSTAAIAEYGRLRICALLEFRARGIEEACRELRLSSHFPWGQKGEAGGLGMSPSKQSICQAHTRLGLNTAYAS